MRKSRLAAIQEMLKPDNLQVPGCPKIDDVVVWDFHDQTGELSLRINVLLSDDTADEARRWRDLEPIDDRIFDILRENEVDEFPYARYITRAEFESEKAA